MATESYAAPPQLMDENTSPQSSVSSILRLRAVHASLPASTLPGGTSNSTVEHRAREPQKPKDQIQLRFTCTDEAVNPCTDFASFGERYCSAREK